MFRNIVQGNAVNSVLTEVYLDYRLMYRVNITILSRPTCTCYELYYTLLLPLVPELRSGYLNPAQVGAEVWIAT